MLSIAVQRLDTDLPLPIAAMAGDVGLDLVSRVDVELAPAGGRAVVPTGIAIAIPPGYGGFVLPRSGLAARHGVTVLNSPGLIDQGYRGEVQVPLINHDPDRAHLIRRGERIAQLVVLAAPMVRLEPVGQLPPPPVDQTTGRARGDGGFGHTGS